MTESQTWNDSENGSMDKTLARLVLIFIVGLALGVEQQKSHLALESADGALSSLGRVRVVQAPGAKPEPGLRDPAAKTPRQARGQ